MYDRTHTHAWVALAGALTLSLLGCRGDRHEVIELAPAAGTAHEAPPVAPRLTAPAVARPVAKKAPVAQRTWSPTPPYEGEVLAMERVGADLLRLTADGVALELRLPKFGECAEDFTQLPTPEMMPESDLRERPVWLALQGDGEAASLRLSTRGALMIIDDGCQRAADVTATLLGTTEPTDDPIFSPDPIAPEAAHDASDVGMRRRGRTKATIMYAKKPLIDVSFFNGESTLTASALDDERWIRLLITREWEYTENDGAVGREHTLVWTPRFDEPPLLVFDNDYRYGMDGFAREEADVNSTRVHPHATGLLQARGTRHLIYVQNAGRDLCAETNSAFSYRTYDESVEWSFRLDGAKRAKKFGRAATRATFAGGCLDVVHKELKRRRERLTKRAPDAPVRWQAL